MENGLTFFEQFLKYGLDACWSSATLMSKGHIRSSFPRLLNGTSFLDLNPSNRLSTTISSTVNQPLAAFKFSLTQIVMH